MSGEEKMRAKKEQARGKAKESVGRAVGNESLTGKGRMEQAKGEAREAKEKIKDILKGKK